MRTSRLIVAGLIGMSIMLSAAAAAPTSAPAGKRRQQVIKQFDKDGDGVLNLAERREALQSFQKRRLPAAKAGEQLGVPKDARVLKDIEYARVDGKALHLDIYLPSTPTTADSTPSRPWPVVMWIHGGGWRAGDKADCKLAGLCGKGYAVVSVEYRLTDVAPFPAQIYDCKAAVRWVRAHAREYGFEPDHLGVAGSSAGGHLVALLGTSGDVKQLEGTVGGNTEFSSKVQAVADYCGPTSLAIEDFQNPNSEPNENGMQSLTKLLGGPLRENTDKAKQASPVTYVSADDPPFLIVHGTKDPLVPPRQAEILASRLTKANVPTTLHMVEGAGHGCFNPETAELARKFFDEQLKGKPTPSAATHNAD